MSARGTWRLRGKTCWSPCPRNARQPRPRPAGRRPVRRVLPTGYASTEWMPPRRARSPRRRAPRGHRPGRPGRARRPGTFSRCWARNWEPRVPGLQGPAEGVVWGLAGGCLPNLPKSTTHWVDFRLRTDRANWGETTPAYGGGVSDAGAGRGAGPDVPGSGGGVPDARGGRGAESDTPGGGWGAPAAGGGWGAGPCRAAGDCRGGAGAAFGGRTGRGGAVGPARGRPG
mmetsp:Transcript_13850/g.31179  ORF Transcript_13850/g.31179 Transcript_13850/m.31179 type:complete len:228 (-) Transcript_13850:453-1136(-)